MEAARDEFEKLMNQNLADQAPRFHELIQAYPQFARETWSQDNIYPLHYAAGSSFSLSVVQTVFNAYPDAVAKLTPFSPLLLACRCYNYKWPQSDQVILWLLEKYPEASKDKSNSGSTPLHYACRNDHSDQVIRLLLEAYPEASKDKSNSGSTPLHYACRNDHSDQVIRLLLEAYPEANHMVATGGWTPLHVACRNIRSHQVVQLLLDANPETAKLKNNKKGWTPLHVACAVGYSVASVAYHAIQRLLEAYPEAAKLKDKDGSMPLHLACANKNQSDKVVQLLLEAYPDAAKEKSGQTPLRPFSTKIGEKPTKLFVTGMYPCQCFALRDGGEVSTIYNLLRRAPHVLQDNLRSNPLLEDPDFKRIQQNKLKVTQLQAENAELERGLKRKWNSYT